MKAENLQDTMKIKISHGCPKYGLSDDIITVKCLIVPNPVYKSRPLAIHKTSSSFGPAWSVSDFKSGIKIADGNTERNAFQNAIDRIIVNQRRMGKRAVHYLFTQKPQINQICNL